MKSCPGKAKEGTGDNMSLVHLTHKMYQASKHEVGLLLEGPEKPGQDRECGSLSYSHSADAEGGHSC